MTRFIKVLFRKRLFLLKENGSEKTSDSFVCLLIASLSEVLPLALFIVIGELAAETNILNAFLALFIGSICALLTFLCLCEYNFLPQRATSIIDICYQINGELPSFLIGWSLLLNQTSALALYAKSISFIANLNSDHNIQKFILRTFGSISFIDEAPDLVGLVIFLFSYTIFMIIENRKNEKSLSFLTFIITIVVISFFVIVGVLNSHYESNFSIKWQINPLQILPKASICSSIFFSSFLINFNGQQLRHKSILPAVTLVFVITNLILCGFFTFLLQLITYNRSVTSETILFEAGEVQKIVLAKNIVSTSVSLCLVVASLCSCRSICGTIQNMAAEGLLFRFLNESSSSKIKWKSCLFIIVPVTLIIILVPVYKLVDSLAIGYLTLSTILLLCILNQRYSKPNNSCQYQQMTAEDPNNYSSNEFQNQSSNTLSDRSESVNELDSDDSSDTDIDDSSDTDIDDIVAEYKEKLCVTTITKLDEEKSFQVPSQKTVNIMIVCSILLCIVILPLEPLFTSELWYFRLMGTLLIIFGIVITIVIYCQPQIPYDEAKLRIPVLPFVIYIALSLHLMLLVNLSHKNWIWTTIWLIAGLMLYFGYGVQHSSANSEPDASTELSQLPKKTWKFRSNTKL